MTKTKTLVLIMMLIFLSLLISGCSGSGMIAGSWPGITIDGDTAYVANSQAIYHIDLTDEGDQLDAYPAEAIRGATFFHAPFLLDEETLIAGSYDNKVYAIDLDSGAAKEFFNSTKNRWIAEPIFANGMIYYPNSNGFLYAVTPDGDSPWNFETKAAIWAKPLIEDNRLYLASQDHFLYALNAETGDEIWNVDLKASIVNSPVLDENGILYVGSFSNTETGSTVTAIDSTDGSVVWETATEGWVWGSPTLGPENTLYVTDLNANLYAINTTDGSLIWEKLVQAGSAITGSALFFNDAIYVVTRGGAITSYDTNGERLWKEEFGNEDNPIEFHGTPLVAGEDLILVSAVGGDSIVYAFNTKLESLWQFTPENN